MEKGPSWGTDADRRGVDAPLPGGEPGGVRGTVFPPSSRRGPVRLADDGDPSAAEEAAQEIFLRIAAPRPPIAPPRNSPHGCTPSPDAPRSITCGTRKRTGEGPDPFGRGGEDGAYPVQLPGPDDQNPEQVVWEAQLTERFGPPSGTPGGAPRGVRPQPGGRALLRGGGAGPGGHGAGSEDAHLPGPRDAPLPAVERRFGVKPFPPSPGLQEQDGG